MYLELHGELIQTIALCYDYKVVAHTHSTHKMGGKEGITTTQYIIPINNTLKELANIRQVLFIYENHILNQICITTKEPPKQLNYKTIKTYNSKSQTTISLPPEYLPLDKDKKQTATIKYYPQEEDTYNKTAPLMTINITDIKETNNESTAQLETTKKGTYLTWQVEDEIPDELKQLMTKDELEQIHPLLPTEITYNIQTKKITPNINKAERKE